MTKGELVASVAKLAGLTKSDSDKAVRAMLESVKKALKRGESVSLVGFGTFSVTRRKARVGRNPRTGKDMKIPSAKTPKFKAGKGLKEAVR